MRVPVSKSCFHCLTLRSGVCITGVLGLLYSVLHPDPREDLSWTVSLRIFNILIIMILLIAAWKENSRFLVVYIIASFLFIVLSLTYIFIIPPAISNTRLWLVLLATLIQVVS